MSQQELEGTKPWAIVTVFKEDTNANDLQRIFPLIQNLVDEWQNQGKMMWSGAFNDNATGMAFLKEQNKKQKDFTKNMTTSVLEY